eukprot:693913-Rhodomonas_salina.1
MQFTEFSTVQFSFRLWGSAEVQFSSVQFRFRFWGVGQSALHFTQACTGTTNCRNGEQIAKKIHHRPRLRKSLENRLKKMVPRVRLVQFSAVSNTNFLGPGAVQFSSVQFSSLSDLGGWTTQHNSSNGLKSLKPRQL